MALIAKQDITTTVKAQFPVTDNEVAEIREAIATDQVFQCDREFPEYGNGKKGARKNYHAYLSAWTAREIVGWDKSTVKVRCIPLANGNYTYRVTPKDQD